MVNFSATADSSDVAPPTFPRSEASNECQEIRCVSTKPGVPRTNPIIYATDIRSSPDVLSKSRTNLWVISLQMTSIIPVLMNCVMIGSWSFFHGVTGLIRGIGLGAASEAVFPDNPAKDISSTEQEAPPIHQSYETHMKPMCFSHIAAPSAGKLASDSSHCILDLRSVLGKRRMVFLDNKPALS